MLFNQYGERRIETGSTIWFSGVLQGVESNAGDLATDPVRIDVTNSKITFGPWRHVVKLPDSSILIDASALEWPTPRWLGESWRIELTPSEAHEAFFQAARDYGALAWGAAVYSRFGVPGRINVKVLRKPTAGFYDLFNNDDPAGTPELWKSFVIPGAMGNGGANYTGARSKATSACAAAG